ncbi:hypothetical protein CCACVL1_24092 [Corchorus capsularis]|uniref:Protein kinase domain-containing protein n=1 Tax=Corchorus capsularis TaxID=210143 RepID=A0A1R3GQX0_COCAP|nr:hypothetical protein CCACVL1_24092 [Corchorus capsularis]
MSDADEDDVDIYNVLLDVKYSSGEDDPSSSYVPTDDLDSFWEETPILSDSDIDEESLQLQATKRDYDQLIENLDDDHAPIKLEGEHILYYTRDFRAKISWGSFGEVYMGWVLDENSKIIHRLAIKSSHKTTNEKELARREKEWEAEKKFLPLQNHPNIIRLIGYARDERRMYLVYRYMEHGSLSRRLKGETTKPGDIYSMGVLLLQLITKKTKEPWKIKGAIEKRFVTEKVSVVHSSLKEGGCNDEDGNKITTLGLRCLDMDDTKRPTIQEVIEELEQLNAH